MAPGLLQLDNSEYTIGWIAALPHERAAAKAMLDTEHAPPQQKHENDHNIYSLGSIKGPNGDHNVVIAGLPSGAYGTIPAATAATQLLSTFPAIKFGLMVGIGGGIPSNDNDIRLGDIVVSKPEGTSGGVRQYNCGKVTVHGFEERGHLKAPPRVLLNAIDALQSEHEMDESAIPTLLEAMYKKYPKMTNNVKGPAYVYPGAECDRLFEASYEHIKDKKDCSECDHAKEIEREVRSDQNPYIHYGTIASGDHVIKDARQRDLMSKDCLCFETEAAGLMNDFPCLVIRGICDYSDSHKNDQWQKYAAATAAAYAKELLQTIDAADINITPYAREVVQELQTIKSITQGIVQNQERQDLLKWLSHLSVSTRHLESIKKRVEGTGKWLLKDQKFLQWSSRTAECRTLCCYGDAGAGKTIICSLVIDTLREQAAIDSNIGLAYIYCDYRDQEEQTVENIFGAILSQLLGSLPKLPETVLELHKEHAAKGESLKLTDAVDLLHVVCEQFSRVFVCFDALDELDNLRSLLEKLRQSPSSMQIFMTGRRHIEETVQEYLKEDNAISIKAHESDLRLFIEHEIGGDNDLEPDAMDEKLRNDILETVIGSAQGVFLLPTLQIRTILQATTIRDREEALKTLPSNLDDAFGGTMSRIERQPLALFERAGTIIAWIHLASRPLTVNEILCALTIKDGDSSLNLRGLPIRKTLLNCCHGLALIDQGTSTIRLVHYSLQEHLSRQVRIFDLTRAEWHRKISYTCLIFLKFPSVDSKNFENSKSFEEEFENFADSDEEFDASEDPEAQPDSVSETITLLYYAAMQWGHHLRMADQLPVALMELAEEHLNTGPTRNPKSFNLLHKHMVSFSLWRYPYKHILPVHVVAFFGIPGIMSRLISTECDLDVRDSAFKHSPLVWAVLNRHETVVKLLLDTGKVDVDSKDPVGRTILSRAADDGKETIVKLLLATDKVDVDSKDSYGQTPLSFAAEGGHEMVVKLLLATGKVEVDSKDSYGYTPLSRAAAGGHEMVVKLLLATDKVDVDSKDSYGQTPLSFAAEYGNETVVKLLLDTGKVYVDSKDSYGRTPLWWAQWKNHTAIAKLLEQYFIEKQHVKTSTLQNSTET